LEIFEAYPGMYRYKHLPAFARFILDQHLERFVREQISISEKIKVPLLETLLARFTPDQLVQLSLVSSREYLDYLAANKASDQINHSIEKWLKDQLEVVGKFEIVAKDITLINYARQQAFKTLIPLYTSEMQLALDLISEIDTFMLGAGTTSTDIYINLLLNKISEESNLSNKLIEASPAITFIYDLVKSKEVFVSGKVTEVMGYSPEELIQMGDNFILQLSHPDDLHSIGLHLQHLVEENSDRTFEFEYRFLHKDGSYRWLRAYEVIFKRDEEGRPVEILGETFEITHEKEVALALEKREKQLLEAQSIAHLGSYEWDIQNNTSTTTAEVFRIFELDDAQKFEEFMAHVHPDDTQKVKDALAESYVTGHYQCEYRYLKNGKEKAIWSVGRVEFEDDKPLLMSGTVQDITEIRQIEKALVQKTKELEASNQNLQQFAYAAFS
jgi:PAS domain S-box-containing protein